MMISFEYSPAIITVMAANVAANVIDILTSSLLIIGTVKVSQ